MSAISGIGNNAITLFRDRVSVHRHPINDLYQNCVPTIHVGLVEKGFYSPIRYISMFFSLIGYKIGKYAVI